MLTYNNENNIYRDHTLHEVCRSYRFWTPLYLLSLWNTTMCPLENIYCIKLRRVEILYSDVRNSITHGTRVRDVLIPFWASSCPGLYHGQKLSIMNRLKNRVCNIHSFIWCAYSLSFLFSSCHISWPKNKLYQKYQVLALQV